jgi:IclR family acetate operon transcriptional repressor
MSSITAQPTERPAPRVQSAARTVDILLTVARAGPSGISAKRISEELKLPRQVVYHLLHTLQSVEVVHKVAGNSYVLGLAASVIASGYRRQNAAPEHLARYAERAAKLTGETAYLVGWIDDEIVVLANAKGSAAIQAASLEPGTAGDAHARASGKLLLALASDEDVDRYLSSHVMRRRTANTITTRAAFMRELATIRSQMVSVDREEYDIGLTCLAVPVGRAGARYVVGLSGPTERVKANLDTYIEALREAASGGAAEE